MKIKRALAFVALTFIAAFLGYRHIAKESPTYCFDQGRVIPDSEFLNAALKIREGQVRHYGGIDEYEKYIVSLNRNPEEAGRDFDAKDPACCQIFRGVTEVSRNCGVGHAVCVLLKFPPRNDLPKYYKREGRTYLFSECGRLEENY